MAGQKKVFRLGLERVDIKPDEDAGDVLARIANDIPTKSWAVVTRDKKSAMDDDISLQSDRESAEAAARTRQAQIDQINDGEDDKRFKLVRTSTAEFVGIVGIWTIVAYEPIEPPQDQ